MYITTCEQLFLPFKLHKPKLLTNNFHSQVKRYLDGQFRKRSLPPPDDEEQQAELAAKLMKYYDSLPACVSAIEDVNNLW